MLFPTLSSINLANNTLCHCYVVHNNCRLTIKQKKKSCWFNCCINNALTRGGLAHPVKAFAPCRPSPAAAQGLNPTCCPLLRRCTRTGEKDMSTLYHFSCLWHRSWKSRCGLPPSLPGVQLWSPAVWLRSLRGNLRERTSWTQEECSAFCHAQYQPGGHQQAFHNKIKYWATLSAAVGAEPVPGVSITVDASLLVCVVKEYVLGFGLDIPSLKRLSDRTNVPFNDLTDIIISPLAATEITSNLILKVIGQLAGTAALMAAEEGSRFIPILEIPAAKTLSFISTYIILKTILDMLAEDAQRVFKRALDLNTSVW